MTATFTSCARSVSASLALIAVASLPLSATAQSAPVDTSAGLTVSRDASGALRAPTAEEAKALQAKATLSQRGTPAAKPLTRVHSSGAVGARLTNDFMSYSVLVRQADGSVVEQCFDSREEADAAIKAQSTNAAAAKPTVATE